jgi:hypothetical protein
MTSAEERGGPLGVLRCLFDNDRMDLTGQLSNLSIDLRELLSMP